MIDFLILLGLWIAIFVWVVITGKRDIGEMKQVKHKKNAIRSKLGNK